MSSCVLFSTLVVLSCALVSSSQVMTKHTQNRWKSHAFESNPLSKLWQVMPVKHSSLPADPFSSFLIDLKNLQSRINYTFENVHLLGRAMTHASYSEENNKPLNILGIRVVEGAMVSNLLEHNLDISAKDLNHRISEFSKETYCAANGMRLGLEKVIRVSPKTNSSAPAVVCGAFRAIFGAVALDSESIDVGGRVFMGIRDGVGMAVAM